MNYEDYKKMPENVPAKQGLKYKHLRYCDRKIRFCRTRQDFGYRSAGERREHQCGRICGMLGLEKNHNHEKMKQIREGTFEDCDQLEDVYFEGTPEEWEYITSTK